MLLLVKETSVVWTLGKKAVDGTVESIEAAEEPTKLPTVFMPLNLFKWAITQHGFFVEKFVRNFSINLLEFKFCGQMCLFSQCLPSFSQIMSLTWLTLEVLV